MSISFAIWFTVHTIGSLQYDKEHHNLLNQEYLSRIRLLSLIPEVNPNLIIRLDPEGNVLYMNPGVRELLEKIGFKESEVTRILPEGYREIISEHRNPETATCERDVVVRGRTIHYICSPFPNERTLLISGADVTHLKEIEHKLRDLNRNLEKLVVERTQELTRTQDTTILCLAGLAETRDPETGMHIERTRIYVKALAVALQDHPRFRDELDDKTIQLLFKSVPMHDIGKVGIPDSVLLKPGKLSAREWEMMKKHPILGGDALRRAEEQLGKDSFLRLASEIAYYHHERWDGGGYPFGKKGEEIPIAARFMALADVYDALVSKRVYKEAFSHEKAKQIILESRGTHFDPAVVDAFIRVEKKFNEISKELTD